MCAIVRVFIAMCIQGSVRWGTRRKGENLAIDNRLSNQAARGSIIRYTISNSNSTHRRKHMRDVRWVSDSILTF